MNFNWVRQLSAKGILLGGVVDIVATNVVMIPVVVGILATGHVATASVAENPAAYSRALEARPSLYVTALILGSLCSVLGGWVAARVARRAEVLNGAFAGWSCLILGIYGLVKNPGLVPMWQHVAFFVLTPMLGAAGGALRARQVLQSATTVETIEPVTVAEAPTGGLTAVERFVLIANRVFLVISVALASLFAVAFPFMPRTGPQAARTGVIILLVITLGAVVLFAFAGRFLAKRKGGHWIFHAVAFGLILIPVGLLVAAAFVASPRTIEQEKAAATQRPWQTAHAWRHGQQTRARSGDSTSRARPTPQRRREPGRQELVVWY